MKNINLRLISSLEITKPYCKTTIETKANFKSLFQKNNFLNFFKTLELDTEISFLVKQEKELPTAFKTKYKGQQIMLNFNLSDKKEFRISTDWRHKYFPLDCDLSWIEIIESFMEKSNGPTIFAGDSNKRNK